MKKLTYKELELLELKTLQELVYELRFDEAYDIEDRETLIKYYLDWS